MQPVAKGIKTRLTRSHKKRSVPRCRSEMYVDQPDAKKKSGIIHSTRKLASTSIANERSGFFTAEAGLWSKILVT